MKYPIPRGIKEILLNALKNIGCTIKKKIDRKLEHVLKVPTGRKSYIM